MGASRGGQSQRVEASPYSAGRRALRAPSGLRHLAACCAAGRAAGGSNARVEHAGWLGAHGRWWLAVAASTRVGHCSVARGRRDRRGRATSVGEWLDCASYQGATAIAQSVLQDAVGWSVCGTMRQGSVGVSAKGAHAAFSLATCRKQAGVVGAIARCDRC